MLSSGSGAAIAWEAAYQADAEVRFIVEIYTVKSSGIGCEAAAGITGGRVGILDPWVGVVRIPIGSIYPGQ